MLSHERVWAAIDALAARNSLSASGLAKRAGLEFDSLQQVEAAVSGWASSLAVDRIPCRRSSKRPTPRSTNS